MSTVVPEGLEQLFFDMRGYDLMTKRQNAISRIQFYKAQRRLRGITKNFTPPHIHTKEEAFNLYSLWLNTQEHGSD